MHILLVEDEQKIALAVKKGLEQEKYVVDLAFDGNSGFEMALSNTYDILLLDLMLPGMDGFEVCSKLRQINIHTPILMLTARGEIQDKVNGLDTGADDYLTKPFSFVELLARIRALSRRPSSVIKEIKRDGVLARLSAREFQVFEFLKKNQNKTVTKDQIINHVWNFDADVLPNTVEVNIRNLRKKLGSNVIKTVRGFGYVLQS